MKTPQERIAEYLMDYWPGMTFSQLRSHAAEICKLFAPAIDETVRMNTRQECIAEYLERHIDNSESECKELADEIFTLTIADIVEENDRLKAIVNAPCVKVSDKVYDEFAMMAKLQTLEAACAAMREALESVVGHANRRQLIATEGTEDPELHRLDEPDFVLLCKQALSTDAGKSLLDRLQAVEAERDRYKAAVQHAYNWKKDLHPSLIQDLEKALQPAKEQ